MEKIEEREKDIALQNSFLEKRHKELDELQRDRDEKVPHIPKDLLNQYEKIKKGRDGIGIVAIRNNACQGCYMELPPQVISETKLDQRLITCENCNRILYFDENP
jgi:predicted  nucleic acid-binding Zn-ribbon protein